jgi:uncharacterized protein YjbI with pentapeptide repeats
MGKMVVPMRAPVRPRAVSPASGEVFVLEAIVGDLMASSGHGSIQIAGPPGCGKTRALEHLLAVFGGKPEFRCLDHVDGSQVEALSRQGWVVYTCIGPEAEYSQPTAVLRLAPWNRDDLIEYLLFSHKDQCASVLARLGAAGTSLALQGSPELWRKVLDQMARDPSIPSARAALRRWLAELLPEKGPLRARASQVSLQMALNENAVPADPFDALAQTPGLAAAAVALRHRPVRVLLAVERILADISAHADCGYFSRRFPDDLVRETGAAAKDKLDVLAALEAWFPKRTERHAMAASILHAAGTGWAPGAAGKTNLVGAYLSGARWGNKKLPRLNVNEADLSRADLRSAELDDAHADRADLSEANLQGASVQRFTAVGANLGGANFFSARAPETKFEHANLENADLRRADFRKASFADANLKSARLAEADLSQAVFTTAELAGADFSGANLERATFHSQKLSAANFAGARWAGAGLVECDLEGMNLPGADFKGANLRNALLTGSSMPGARFDGADLRGAGLAEIEWERASLRGADLRGVSFHLGSSRNGLVGSPIACEGSRTGFYTDDFTEQDFKAPEEIRKANLCRADLREAVLDGVDFYLVDLRHALFDPEQEAHFRRCGAILEAVRPDTP